jgi:hypothetical protein
MSRLRDCQGEIPGSLPPRRVLCECGRPMPCADCADVLRPAEYHRPRGWVFLGAGFLWLALIMLVWSFYRVGRWYGWWP